MRRSRLDGLREFALPGGLRGRCHSLDAIEQAGLGTVSRLPVSIRILLESVLRNCDGRRITEEHVRALAGWSPNAARSEEVPFVVARVLLQDFTGVPLLVDLAAMRAAAVKLGRDPGVVEPRVPADLVIDHSVQVDRYASPEALRGNMETEFARNRERYRFLKWGTQAFDGIRVIPPGIGIVHQVNLEYLFRGVHERGGIYFPDTLVGTDSHTTMINAAGVVGWGVGGIEAEAAMLGQPVFLLAPDVVGVELRGRLREGVTATDLVLTLTQRLRAHGVTGKFVEFFGEGAESLTLTDRATVANMAPEYGATMGFFPVDGNTLAYLRGTGRSARQIGTFESYFKAQGLFGMPRRGEIDYTETLALDLAEVAPSLAGPRRPQDRVQIGEVAAGFRRLFSAPVAQGGFGRQPGELERRFPAGEGMEVGSGDVLIAAITPSTNTSNPGVLIAAGVLARKAVERGLEVPPRVKTSLAPGSRAVTEYLARAGLLPSLERLGFGVAAYGCTTCIGNSGPLAAPIEQAIARHDLVCAAVLSGNRNFEARIHPAIRANYLASPPLVVAYALAGTLLRDLMTEPVGLDANGIPVWLGEIWPTAAEIASCLRHAADARTYRRLYSDLGGGDLWKSVPAPAGRLYEWSESTFIAHPPFFEDFGMRPAPHSDIFAARALLVLGDSVTTDHISPAGSIAADSPAGQWLSAHGVAPEDFNSYGSRRGNHEVMIRGTFANVRLKNLLCPPRADGSRAEGGYTVIDGRQTTVFEAAMEYRRRGIPTLVFAGEEYGTGSSRDWAAKGTQLLGVRAVVARSFERIHRSNLVGMGVLPLQFRAGESAGTLQLDGSESFDLSGIRAGVKPGQEISLVVRRRDGSRTQHSLLARIDTPIEADYFRHGGILPFVLRQLLAG